MKNDPVISKPFGASCYLPGPCAHTSERRENTKESQEKDRDKDFATAEIRIGILPMQGASPMQSAHYLARYFCSKAFKSASWRSMKTTLAFK